MSQHFLNETEASRERYEADLRFLAQEIGAGVGTVDELAIELRMDRDVVQQHLGALRPRGLVGAANLDIGRVYFLTKQGLAYVNN